jgi:hypothetical protein
MDFYSILIYSLILNLILLISLLSPNIVYLIHKYHFIWKNTDEHGYSTPKQYRYKNNTKVILLKDNTTWTIIEMARYDYLIQNSKGVNKIVLQSEIKLF